MPIRLLMAERSQTVILRTRCRQTQRLNHEPFGGLGIAPGPGQVAFTGQWRSADGDLYLLGNGYRAYLPSPKRFAQPDRHSPFGVGGLSPYAYCGVDPVNRTDPTGAAFTPLIIGSIVAGGASAVLQAVMIGTRSAKTTPARMMWGLRLAILAGLAAVASGITAGVVAEDSSQRTALTWASIGLGLGSAALRLSVAVPQLRNSGSRKFFGRLLGVRRGMTIGPRRGHYELARMQPR
ncbi:RHS repeat-associated core domain-containing protein [Pseudomonas sp. DC3000-4b1]|uniref:RHS repeat-associated core domain-containing protein n=1 Tax=unclassified Pseudomonas TaxID=196821 RepID=UPI003CEB7EF8